MAFLPSEDLEHGSELLCQEEEAPICGLLLTARGLVAQGMDEAVGGQAGGGDAALGPELVHFGEEASDLTPAGSLTRLARFADQHNEEIEAVAGEADHAVRRRPDQVAEGDEKLQKDGGRIGLCVGRHGADHPPGQAVERGLGQRGPRGSLAGRPHGRNRRRWWDGGSGSGIRRLLRREAGLPVKQLRATALYVGEGGQGEWRLRSDGVQAHNSTLLWFPKGVETQEYQGRPGLT